MLLSPLSLMTHKAHFHLPRYVNKQNYCYWAPGNPQKLQQHPPHSKKLTVCFGVTSFGVNCPYFFEENVCARVTVTYEWHVETLCTFCEPVMSQWNQSVFNTVSTRWGNCTFSKGIKGCSATDVPTACHFSWW